MLMYPTDRDLQTQERLEDLLADAYYTALAQWMQELRNRVLPTVTGADEQPPPDIDAVLSVDSVAVWEELWEEFVAPFEAALWCYAFVTALRVTDPGNALLASLTADARRRPDLVADLVELAWYVNPGQVATAARLVREDVTNRRMLERFLGARRDTAAKTMPGRLRDILVGGTSRKTRAALSVSELRGELGSFFDVFYDPKSRKGRWADLADRAGNRAAVQSFVPTPTGRVYDMYQRIRDQAAAAGLQAAGIINQAVLNAASQAYTQFDKVWVAHMDPRTRPTHFAAHGQRSAGFNGTFRVGGADLDYPGDPSGPPEEIRNCRCRVGMVPVGEAMPEQPKYSRYQQRIIDQRRGEGIVRAYDDPDGIGYITTPVAASAAPRQEDTMTDTISEAPPEAVTYRTFSDAVIAFLGVPTSDYRLLKPDMNLSFRTFPLPLMWCRQSKEGHDDSFTIGVIEAAKVEDGKVLASGYLLNTAEADEAVELLKHGVTRPSVDLSGVEWALTDEEGTEISEEQFYELPSNAKVFRAFSAGELIGTTLVSTPAFGDTSLSLNDSPEARDSNALVAAVAHVQPRTYPASHFTDPHLTEPTLPTLSNDGRVYGHIACWGTCHRSVQTSCVMAPRSPSNYSHFHTSPAVRLDDDSRLPVGRLTINTGHAPDTLSGIPAQAHYDNTGSCWALVRVGEDKHGIWFSGVPAPWATPEQVEAGLCAPLSGDWRDFGEGLELVAALSVNTPGFAARGRDDDLGRPVALVAALGPGPDTEQALSRDDVKAAVAEALAEQRFTAERDAALARAAKLAPMKSARDLIGERLAKVGL